MARIRTIKPEFWAKNCEVWLHGYCLYVIQEVDSGLLKIGVAAHPIRRLSMLQCGNPRVLALREIYAGDRVECRRVERCLHQKFAGENLRGEWFRSALSCVLVALEEMAK